MAHFRVAKRYAKGLMQFLDNSSVKEALLMSEMSQIKSIISENKDVKNFFVSPVIEYRNKIKITREIFKDFSEETKTFLSLVIKQGRSEAIESIASEYIQLYKKKNKIVSATITSASPLDTQQLDAIVLKAKSNLPVGSTVEVKNKVNPELIGGFILRLGDKQFDASLKTKLENIKKEFDSNQFISKI